MRVLVVGAGLAGLTCARELMAAGADVTVLEARSRVGGRVEGGKVAGAPVDLGGHWLGPGQTRMYELAAEFGLAIQPTWNTGAMLIDLLGRQSRMKSHRGAVPRLSPFALADLGQGLARFTRLSRRTDLEAPWSGPDALRWDSQTFATWIDRNLRTAAGRAYFRVACEAVFAADAADLSMLHAMFYAHAGTDLETLLATDQGAQQDEIVGGAYQVAEGLAGLLGQRVRLNEPVRSITQDDGQAGVTTYGGEHLAADAVVVALPPALAGRIDYSPALPAARDQLTQRVPAGSVIKILVAYDRPFWRAAGLNGQAASDTGPVKVVFDTSPPDSAGSPGVLTCFLEGGEARIWSPRPATQRREMVLACLERYFGAAARSPIDYTERDWSAEQFTRGCYGAHFTTGTWTAYGPALRTPVGRVHWAGTECSPVWNGYMEGAVRSGETVARDLLAAARRP